MTPPLRTDPQETSSSLSSVFFSPKSDFYRLSEGPNNAPLRRSSPMRRQKMTTQKCSQHPKDQTKGDTYTHTVSIRTTTKTKTTKTKTTRARYLAFISVWWTPTSSSFGSHGKRRDVAVEFGDAVLFGAPDDGDANRSRGIAERVYGSREDAPDC